MRISWWAKSIAMHFQARENQLVRAGDEGQTRVQFYIYHISQPTPK
jgi:hypothetical protein